MTDGVKVDQSDVHRLAADLGRIPGRVVPLVDKVVERGALNVKNVMAEDAGGHPRFPHFPRSISYDRAYQGGSVGYEIGPDKARRQGALGNIFYLGTSTQGPTLDIMVGLRDEEPKLEKHLADLSTKMLGL